MTKKTKAVLIKRMSEGLDYLISRLTINKTLRN